MTHDKTGDSSMLAATAPGTVQDDMKVNPGKKHILLIDDDKNFGRIFSAIFQAENFELHCIQSVRQLKNADHAIAYEVALVDYDLDDMTGYQVAEILREKLQGTPVIMISATNRPAQDCPSELNNISGFVSKWQSPEIFMQEVLAKVRDNPASGN